MQLPTYCNNRGIVRSACIGPQRPLTTSVTRDGRSNNKFSPLVAATSPSSAESDFGPATGATWDPDGVLPPPPSEGHFARRERQQQNLSGAAAALLGGPATAKKSPAAAVLPPAPLRQASTTNRIGENTVAPEAGVGKQIESIFLETFLGDRGAPRVLESFRRLQAGRVFKKDWPEKGMQDASSYMEGLFAEPFPDVHSGHYPWLEAVEKQAHIIQEEFATVMADANKLAKGTNVWVPAVREDALDYGPEWRTLVIQDRGHWDKANSKIFPKTTKIFQNMNAPTLEVFFARQEGKTGIKPHTDNTNFIQTSHLGIDVPEGQCWIKVGNYTKEWRNGKVIICDTSFIHSTRNDADVDRYVLIMRHWHPQVTPLERIATQFLFEAVDDATPEGLKAAQKKAGKAVKALSGSGRKKVSTGGGGFGA